ncbi:hypothetical protein MRB53_008388 [Persea americana]|uniref:Uncharacterized protein n=1 Tax=Persea americana TaxID=3435 RepID=A0ACC2MML5_PERAE|nr:hypothetical protein MRB53_008388 [Persea americana]|eukprot:TRINITY_DN1547_c0_g1_i1.p1 TRINITY_DN1547_c0_g1~~TRINITY_DN1547_c0_g1_i1.p1  ORF type:complete len:140 (-),score=31.24 TRINITY_DN1547_c0_g1_i1:346-765(-)
MSIHALQRSKKSQQQQQPEKGRRRFLITVNVLGSAGPLRFLVNEEELVATVIDTVLRSYAREGRLPVLGFDLDNFLLYSANAGSDALSPKERIGSCGGRNFLLCKKQQAADEGSSPGRKGGGSWKAWLNKALNLKVYSH